MVDVAIVGASSAGLFAAEQLARAGRHVVVIERQTVLQPDRRTLIITPQLRSILGDLTNQVVVHTTQIMAVQTPAAQTEVTLHDPDLIIERSHLTQQLADRAAYAGAQLYYGQRFVGLDPHPDGALLHIRTAQDESKHIVARNVIGADGAFSRVASAAGLKLPLVVPIIQAEVALPPNWNPDRTQVWFDVDETRFFYWLIPESNRVGVVGLVGEERGTTRALLDQFLERHALVPYAYQASQVAMYHPRLRPWGRVGTAAVLLVGDAAGQVKVTTVGGTVSGLWGAQAAVQALLTGQPYRTTLRALNRELLLHWGIRFLLERLDNPGYDELTRCVTHPVRQFLSRYNRDAMVQPFWQVPFLQPRFVPLALRMLWGTKGKRTPSAAVPTAELESHTSR